MNTLKQRILDDIKTAMRASDKARLVILRLLAAACKQKEVDERIELNDAAVLDIIKRFEKRARDAMQQFKQAGRNDLLEKEAFELEVIQTYLPVQLTDDEIERLISETIASTGATSLKDMGKLMGALKPHLQGRADMKKVSDCVKQRLD